MLAMLALLIFTLLSTTQGSADAPVCHPRHFVLVHGAAHGAWCWYKVTYLLKQAGHKVDTVDLLSAGINNFDPSSVRTVEGYSSPLLELIQKLPPNHTIVLVGHSLGGLTLTYVLEKFPNKIAAGIYVAALMLPNGPAAVEIRNKLFKGVPKSYLAPSPPGTISLRLDIVQELIYNLSPPEDVELAKSLLKPIPILDPAVNFTHENYGRVPRYYIKTMHDNVLPDEDQDLMIRKTPPCGVATIDADHSAFFSNPKTLANLLAELAAHHQ